MTLETIAFLLALGAGVGVLAGMLGIGGGMVMVPFMIPLLEAHGVPPEHLIKIAIATALATIVFTSLSSVRAHHRAGAVRWPIVAALAPGIVLGSLLGAQVAAIVSGRWLTVFFALFLGFMATQMMRAPRRAAGGSDSARLPPPLLLFGTGTGIGVLSTLVGAGGAFLTVPFLTSRGLRIQNAVACSAACGFPIAVAGTLGYMWAGRNLDAPLPGMIGFVYTPALFVIVAASVLTAPLGVRAAHSIGTITLRRVFAWMFYAMASYMLWKAFVQSAS